MPELPEVETIVRELNKKVCRKKIVEVKISAPKLVSPSAVVFRRKLTGSFFTKVSRRAKMLVFSLASGDYLLVHLKMTGQLVYRKKDGRVLAVGGHPIAANLQDLPNKFSHVIFTFNDGSKLFYNDVRKFGWLKILSPGQLAVIHERHGLEPLERSYTLENFKKILARYPNRKIKQVLLDQRLLAGVGNIYADESCFAAGILPERLSSQLTVVETKKLFLVIPKILKLSIKHGGTSADDYVRTDGSRGDFWRYLKVYGRAGQLCKRCNGTIKKIKLNARGTHFCSSCQK